MHAGTLSSLDNIRISNGCENLKKFFRHLLKENPDKAAEMINDEKLRFESLYLLRSELSKADAIGMLNPLYRRALELSKTIMSVKTANADNRYRSIISDDIYALKWMIKSSVGSLVNAISYCDKLIDNKNEYRICEQLIEAAASLLAIRFHDFDTLPEIAEMIFWRNKYGRLIHELVWAFFEARSIDSLLLIAQRLNSEDARDAALSAKLLQFVPDIRKEPFSDYFATGSVLYQKAVSWISDNKPFLYYTGESMHMGCLPIFYDVSQPCKYLCHPVSVDNGKPVPPLNEYERMLESQFMELPEEERQKLADFSYLLYRKNSYQWSSWIHLPIDKKAYLSSKGVIP